MAKGMIRRIEIEPAENGGHTVTHFMKEKPIKDSRGHSGMSMGYQEPEKHVFGDSEDGVGKDGEYD